MYVLDNTFTIISVLEGTYDVLDNTLANVFSNTQQLRVTKHL